MNNTILVPLTELEKVPDEVIARELIRHGLSVDGEKYQTAFSCYGIAHQINLSNSAELGAPPAMPHEEFKAIQRTAAYIFKGYTALVYMRSDHLERGLDSVPDASPLRPFRDAFRKGRQGHGDGTLVQHLRNSLCHGSFRFADGMTRIRFVDRPSNWELDLPLAQFAGICD